MAYFALSYAKLEARGFKVRFNYMTGSVSA